MTPLQILSVNTDKELSPFLVYKSHLFSVMPLQSLSCYRKANFINQHTLKNAIVEQVRMLDLKPLAFVGELVVLSVMVAGL